jgi:hypothetical protein
LYSAAGRGTHNGESRSTAGGVIPAGGVLARGPSGVADQCWEDRALSDSACDTARAPHLVGGAGQLSSHCSILGTAGFVRAALRWTVSADRDEERSDPSGDDAYGREEEGKPSVHRRSSKAPANQMLRDTGKDTMAPRPRAVTLPLTLRALVSPPEQSRGEYSGKEGGGWSRNASTVRRRLRQEALHPFQHRLKV